jgi:hypothetical protein
MAMGCSQFSYEWSSVSGLGATYRILPWTNMALDVEIPMLGIICCHIWNLTTSQFRQGLAQSDEDLRFLTLPSLLGQRNL